MTRQAQNKCPRRPGFTLLELMVAISIIVVLIGIAVFGVRAAHGFANKNAAQQQIKILANAIDQYASFWPRWQAGGVVIAEKGWPDFIPERLFLTGPNYFTLVSGFNDKPSPTFLSDGSDPYPHNANNQSGIWYDPNTGEMTYTEGDAERGAECLTYALTSATGKGPYIKDEMKGNLQDAQNGEFYPVLGGSVEHRLRSKIIDPWGTAYRYFWVYADSTTGNGRAYKGFLPVTYGAFQTGVGFGGVDNPSFKDPNTGSRMTAVGFVLESAGPDKRFGNVWKANPTPQEINDAADNLTIMP